MPTQQLQKQTSSLQPRPSLPPTTSKPLATRRPSQDARRNDLYDKSMRIISDGRGGGVHQSINQSITRIKIAAAAQNNNETKPTLCRRRVEEEI